MHSTCASQLEMLQDAAEQGKRQEAAAKAVLLAAQKAAKSRAALSPAEAEAIKNDILFPPTAEELQQRREAEQQVRLAGFRSS